MSRRRICTVRYYRLTRFPDTGQWPADGDGVGALRRAVSNVRDPYIEHNENHYIVETHNDDPLHVSVATVRRDNLPLVERQGHTTALHLSEDENLAEPTHLLFFDKRIVAVVRGQLTPGHLVAGNVLAKRSELDIILAPIIRPEVATMLVNSRAVVQLDMTVAGTSFSNAAADAGDPVEAVRRLTSQFAGAATANLTLKAKTNPDRQRFRSWLIRQVERGTLGEQADRLKVTILDAEGQKQTVDLLEDQIAHREEVEFTSAARYMDPGAIRTVVERSYEAQRMVLSRAIELHGA